MASVAELMVKIAADVNDFTSGMKETTDGFTKMKKMAGTASKVVKTGFVAAGVAMAALGTATAVAGKKVFDAVGDVAAAGDEIDKMSQKLGLSAESYQEWSFVLSQSGVEINSLQTGMKTLTNSMDDARNGSKKAVGLFDELNISMENLGEMSREDIFEATIKGLQGIEDETVKAALANDLFGKSGQDLIPLLNQTEESTEALMEQVSEMGFVLSNDAVAAAAAYTDAMDVLKTTFGGVKKKIVAELLPGFTTVVEGFAEMISGAEGTEEKIKGGVDEIAKAFESMAPKITGVLMVIVSMIGAIAPTIITTLIDGILNNMGTLLETGFQIVTTVLNALISALPQLTSGAIQVLLFLANTIIENLPMLLDAALQVIITLADGVVGALPELIPALIDTVIMIVETLIDNIDMLVEASIAIIIALAQGIIDALPRLIEKAPVILNSLIDAIVNNLPLLIDASIEILLALTNALVQNIPLLLNAIPTIMDALVRGFIASISIMGNLGFKLISGLWNGIKDADAWLNRKIRGFFSGVVTSIKNFFGIKSPSTLFADMGGSMADGLGMGFASEMKSMTKSMENSIPKTFDAPKINRATSGTTRLSSKAPIRANTINGTSGVSMQEDETSQKAQNGKFNINIASLVVRDDADIEKIAQRLFKLEQSRIRAVGGRI